MAIAYNDVPLASQQIDQSQAPIRQNFNSITALIDVDHETFTDTKEGYHKALHIVDGVPAPLLVAGEGSIYVDTNNVFIKNGTGTAVSLTSTTGSVTEGSYTLPNGLIMKWGRTTGGGLLANDWTQITYPVAFPTTCFNIQVTSKAVTVQPSTAQTTASVILDVNYASNLASFYVFNRRTDAGAGYVADCTWFAIGN